MKIVAILPPPPFTKREINNFIKKVREIYSKAKLQFYCRDIIKDKKYYKNIVKDSFIILPDYKFIESTTKKEIFSEKIIILYNRFDDIAINMNKINWFEKNFEIFFFKENLFKIKDGILIEDYIIEKRDVHFFYDIAKNTQKNLIEYTYYPYGFFVRQPFSDECNDFGFRVPENYLDLINRGKNHILICTFGGSTAYGVNVPYNKCYSYILERKLNYHLKNDSKITVLNFGMPSYVILNEIITYILFVWELNPEIVVSFSGFNDLYYGIFTDSYLLEKFDMNYAYWLETWAAKLRNIDIEIPYSWRMGSNNKVRPIIKAFVSRLYQFKEIVENSGSKFIFALQPFWGSRKAHHNEELKSFCCSHNKEPNNSLISLLKFLYNRLKIQLKQENIYIDIDFDEIFRELGNEYNFFSDICNFNSNGEKFIAEKFFNLFISDNKFRRVLNGKN